LCNNPTHNVTITGSHVYGTSTTTFNYNGGTLPSGVTSVMGPLIDCLSSVTSGDTPGLYNGTITNCQGLAFVGTNAPKFTMAYVDGGVTVTKAPTTTTLTHSPPSPLLNQAVTFTATVTPTSGSAAVTGTVSFYIDGSLTAAATVPVSSGQASFTTTFGVGTHHVVAVYSGDTDYLGSTSNTDTVTITCTQTITGNHSSLTVTSGTTCLSNAHISGGISVAKGAVLDLENSTVTGSITANKPAGFRMCGSTTGGVSVSGATGFVLIGDPANNCPANTITAGLTVANNTAGLVVIGNTIAASITAYGNSGTSPLGQPVTISGNHH
jgi:hypothetical protein